MYRSLAGFDSIKPRVIRLSKDLAAITAPVFEFKLNPFQEAANQASEAWFRNFNTYDDKKLAGFLGHRFDVFAGMSFPNMDEEHLETCLNFFFWAFSFDDLSDEGDLQSKPDDHQVGVDISLSVLKNPAGDPPAFPYAAMLHDLWKRMNATATKGACTRFARAVENWCRSQVQQSANRADQKVPSVAEFIVMRRLTIGGAMVEAIIEYGLDLDLPDYVFEDPVLSAMSTAMNDITTWPNDLCSFNKEQADGDNQNLVYCVMVERNTDLQGAIDIVTEMLRERVAEYVELKKQLPSFGPEVDRELARYVKGLENFVQGTIVWYYDSPRYFRDLDVSDRKDLVIPLFSNAVTVVSA